jgi:AraC-like DNA-binding protein
MNLSLTRDQLVDWLLGNLSLETAVFHAGRYCGAWQASTAGRMLESFHLVLEGHCWLHQPGRTSVELHPGDSVLFLRDVPHHLSPNPDASVRYPPAAMRPFEETAGGTGLVCGFFQFRDSLTALMLDGLPDALLIRASDTAGEAIATTFTLIRAEANGDPDAPSPLLARLLEVLFFYAIREALKNNVKNMPGLWALARTEKMSALLSDLLTEPGHDWTVNKMAARVHMSRTNFWRRFVELSGQSPAAFLTALRIRIAAQRLEKGDTIERTAEYVGYGSTTAFSRAFKKAMGKQPGVWRRVGQLTGGTRSLQ